MRDLLISGARLADGSSGDLGVSGERFVEPGDVRDAERIQAEGLLALPGLVDPHTHLREPGREDAETVATGTLAAARGGFTAVSAMANLDPVTDTAEAAEHLAALAARTGSTEVIVVGSVTKGLAGEQLSEICLLYTSPSPRDRTRSRMPSSA